MIELFKYKGDYIIRTGLFRDHGVLDNLTLKDLEVLHKKIGKVIGKPDYKEIMIKDKAKYL